MSKSVFCRFGAVVLALALTLSVCVCPVFAAEGDPLKITDNICGHSPSDSLIILKTQLKFNQKKFDYITRIDF